MQTKVANGRRYKPFYVREIKDFSDPPLDLCKRYSIPDCKVETKVSLHSLEPFSAAATKDFRAYLAANRVDPIAQKAIARPHTCFTDRLVTPTPDGWVTEKDPRALKLRKAILDNAEKAGYKIDDQARTFALVDWCKFYPRQNGLRKDGTFGRTDKLWTSPDIPWAGRLLSAAMSYRIKNRQFGKTAKINGLKSLGVVKEWANGTPYKAEYLSIVPNDHLGAMSPYRFRDCTDVKLDWFYSRRLDEAVQWFVSHDLTESGSFLKAYQHDAAIVLSANLRVNQVRVCKNGDFTNYSQKGGLIGYEKEPLKFAVYERQRENTLRFNQAYGNERPEGRMRDVFGSNILSVSMALINFFSLVTGPIEEGPTGFPNLSAEWLSFHEQTRETAAMNGWNMYVLHGDFSNAELTHSDTESFYSMYEGGYGLVKRNSSCVAVPSTYGWLVLLLALTSGKPGTTSDNSDAGGIAMAYALIQVGVLEDFSFRDVYRAFLRTVVLKEAVAVVFFTKRGRVVIPFHNVTDDAEQELYVRFALKEIEETEGAFIDHYKCGLTQEFNAWGLSASISKPFSASVRIFDKLMYNQWNKGFLTFAHGRWATCQNFQLFDIMDRSFTDILGFSFSRYKEMSDTFMKYVKRFVQDRRDRADDLVKKYGIDPVNAEQITAHLLDSNEYSPSNIWSEVDSPRYPMSRALELLDPVFSICSEDTSSFEEIHSFDSGESKIKFIKTLADLQEELQQEGL